MTIRSGDFENSDIEKLRELDKLLLELMLDAHTRYGL